MSDHICPGCGLRFKVTLEALPSPKHLEEVADDQPARPVGPSRAAWLERKETIPHRSQYRDYWTGKQPDDPSGGWIGSNPPAAYNPMPVPSPKPCDEQAQMAKPIPQGLRCDPGRWPPRDEEWAVR